MSQNVATHNPAETVKQECGETHECTRSGHVFRPNVDIIEHADELTIRADIPGAAAQDIDINFEKGTLTIHAKVHDREPENVSYLAREFAVGDFHRVFQVSEKIDAERIAADYSDGVLTLHLPKVAAIKARKIEIANK